jgi:hypothetical protein
MAFLQVEISIHGSLAYVDVYMLYFVPTTAKATSGLSIDAYLIGDRLSL